MSAGWLGVVGLRLLWVPGWGVGMIRVQTAAVWASLPAVAGIEPALEFSATDSKAEPVTDDS